MPIDPLDAAGDPGQDFPWDGSCLHRGFVGGDFFFALPPDEDGFFSDRRIFGKRGNVDHDLIHRHASEKGAAMAADEDMSVPPGEGARVAVAVADPKGR